MVKDEKVQKNKMDRERTEKRNSRDRRNAAAVSSSSSRRRKWKV
jgi:hypothetical protein